MSVIEIYPDALEGQKEIYHVQNADMFVGNLIMGERYIEPQGSVTIKNITSGDTCQLKFHAYAGWFKNAKAKALCEGLAHNANGLPMFKIEGQYTSKLTVIDLSSGQSEIIFEAPRLPEDRSQMFNFNFFTL